MFLAISPHSLSAVEELQRVAEGAIDALHAATPIEPGKPARYPGEGALRIRAQSARLGVAVEEDVWKRFCGLEAELAV